MSLFPSSYTETQQINEKRVVVTSWLRVDKTVLPDIDFVKLQEELSCEKLSLKNINSTHPGISRECLVSYFDEDISNYYAFNYVARWSYKNSGHIDDSMAKDISRDSDEITNFVAKTLNSLQKEAYNKIEKRGQKELIEKYRAEEAQRKSQGKSILIIEDF